MNKTIKYTLAVILSVSLAAIIFSGCDDSVNETADEYTIYKNNIINLLPKNRIPPLENPEYVSIDEAGSFLYDEDMVFVLESVEGIYVYPQRIMVWHEVVNEEIGGTNISLTYCPLTGSAIGYKNSDGNTFGTSGSLVNSNLILYDRNTESYIPQIFGTGINGEMKGTELETIPVYWARWENVKNTYETAFVLSIKTGFQRDYSRDPYGSYINENTYDNYYFFGEPIYDVLNEDDGIFPSKKVVIGVKSGGNTLAINPDKVREEGRVEFTINNLTAAAVYDEELDIVR